MGAMIEFSRPDGGKTKGYLATAGQGRPACVRIPWGNGVCGTAAACGETVLVPDVHEFPGHIACDPVSQPELVVPLIEDGRVTGVLDLDSPSLARFDAEDRAGCEHLVAVFLGR